MRKKVRIRRFSNYKSKPGAVYPCALCFTILRMLSVDR